MVLIIKHFESQAFERQGTGPVTSNFRENLYVVSVEYELVSKLPAYVAFIVAAHCSITFSPVAWCDSSSQPDLFLV